MSLNKFYSTNCTKIHFPLVLLFKSRYELFKQPNTNFALFNFSLYNGIISIFTVLLNFKRNVIHWGEFSNLYKITRSCNKKSFICTVVSELMIFQITMVCDFVIRKINSTLLFVIWRLIWKAGYGYRIVTKAEVTRALKQRPL